ncbi:TIM barrel protein [Candidatus Peregrinibacteria bacterium]|nr:TIM barrel protein [Candidatus Peregrinibacteria bacterium]
MLIFAVPGTPRSTPLPGGTIEGLKRTKELGFSAMEIEWVQRVPSNVDHIEEIGGIAKSLDITLTIHAPYFVNFNATDPEKKEASIKRVLTCLMMAEIVGAISVCVHPAFYLGMDPKKAMDNVRRCMDRIMKHRDRIFPHVNLALETMGKPTQFGTLEEVLALSKEFDCYPCVDPAHLHARSNGAINTEAEWNTMFNQYADTLGKESLKTMHLHYSGIAYGPKGERKHLPLKDSDANWKGFIRVLKERRIGGICVCESPLQEEDTLLMKKTFLNIMSLKNN